MKNKLAMWSWILPIIGIIINSLLISMSVINRNITTILGAMLLIGSTIIGFVFGIVGLNSKMDGKTHARVGIILNILLFIYWLFVFLIASLFVPG